MGVNVSSDSTITRRDLLKNGGASFAVVATSSVLPALVIDQKSLFPSKRPHPSDRKFQSAAVEAFILETTRQIADPELAAMFTNCFPNTLDTTVEVGEFEGKASTAVINGDLPSMWLRNSTAQVWPYLPLAAKHASLRRLLEGVIRRQTRCLLIDPYANSFMADLNAPPLEWSVKDKTEMKPGVGERKYELDSLCYPIRLAHGYWKATGDTSAFDGRWKKAMQLVLQTMRVQQRKDGPDPYRFQRSAENPTDSLVNGIGNPVKPVGLIASCFRPSDDACIFSFLVPSNLFAVRSLRQLADMAETILNDSGMALEARSLAKEVETALHQYALVDTAAGSIWAYEVDGYGGRVLMDDANVPSLLGLPYLESSPDAALYGRTRSFVWSERNPWFYKGKAGEGIGGPHIGRDRIWAISPVIFALTINSECEIVLSICVWQS